MFELKILHSCIFRGKIQGHILQNKLVSSEVYGDIGIFV
jgi:hypothetical protein